MGAPSQFLPGQVEAAIVELLQDALGGDGGMDVQAIGLADFNDDGTIVMSLPGVRVLYDDSPYDARDTFRLIYNTRHQFQIWCADQDLSGSEAQRQAALAVVDQVLPVLAGTQLTLSDGTQSEPIQLRGVSRFRDDDIGMVYVVAIDVPGIAQLNATVQITSSPDPIGGGAGGTI